MIQFPQGCHVCHDGHDSFQPVILRPSSPLISIYGMMGTHASHRSYYVAAVIRKNYKNNIKIVIIVMMVVTCSRMVKSSPGSFQTMLCLSRLPKFHDDHSWLQPVIFYDRRDCTELPEHYQDCYHGHVSHDRHTGHVWLQPVISRLLWYDCHDGYDNNDIQDGHIFIIVVMIILAMMVIMAMIMIIMVTHHSNI
jgi:hypothetical protein